MTASCFVIEFTNKCLLEFTVANFSHFVHIELG